MGDKGCVLVTGGAGYIGSHCVIALIEAGYSPVIVDNLVNSSLKCVDRLEEITGLSIPFYKYDVLNKSQLKEIFSKHKFSCVIHLAGLKAVGESVELPLLYYKNNIDGTLCLLNVMKEFGVKQLVFSSSATVYGDPQYLPLDEKHPVGACTNPYGKTKYFIEEILKDLCTSDKSFNVVSLRYFNPVGCHKSGRIGEDPRGVPNNLMPFVAQVAVGRREKVMVYGNDYNTKDGTGVRDYIHVVDLASGHVAAMNKLSEGLGFTVYNLGTGTGSSVLDMIKALQTASGKPIPYEMASRRAGDCASVYADPSLAEKELSWKATRGLDEMCEDLWRWQSNNPSGFGDSVE